MKKILTTIALLALSALGQARIGETFAEATQRYGGLQDVTKTGEYDDTWHWFKLSGFQVGLVFDNDKVVELEYFRDCISDQNRSETSKLSDNEIRNFLMANGGSRLWTDDHGLAMRTFRTDGLIAYYFQLKDSNIWVLVIATEQHADWINHRQERLEDNAQAKF
jgi:hypothetical protein